MKYIITIIALLLLFSFQTFSQNKSYKRVILEKFTIEKPKEIHKSNVDALERLNDNKFWLLNSKNSQWEKVLRNQQERFYIEERFNIKDSRTAIKKTLLDNGFLLLEEIFQTWDGSAWVNSSKNSNTYDGNNNLTEVLSQIWDGSAWVNSSKRSNTYDGNNNLTEVHFQSWDGSAWVNSSKDTYTYDGNNNLTEVLFQIWDDSAWVNFLKVINLYIPTGTGQFGGEVNTYSLSSNYPNPFNPTTKISYTIPERSNVSLKIFDLLGSEVAELVKGEIEAGSYIIEFNASTLPSGIYFYKLQAGDFVETKKMVLMK